MDSIRTTRPTSACLLKAQQDLCAVAADIHAAIEHLHANAAAARDAVDAAARSAIEHGFDAAVITDNADALFSAIDAAQERKLALLEAEAVDADDALNLIIRAAEEGALETFSADDAVRVIELSENPLTGPREPPNILFSAALPAPAEALGRIVAPPASCGPDRVSVEVQPRAWCGPSGTMIVRVVLAEEESTAFGYSAAHLDTLTQLAQSLRAVVRLVMPTAGDEHAAVVSAPAPSPPRPPPLPVTFIANLVARAVEARVCVPEDAVAVSGGRGRPEGAGFVVLESLCLGRAQLLPVPGCRPPRIRLAADMRVPLTLPGAAVGFKRGSFLCTSSHTGMLFIGAKGTPVIRAYNRDGTIAFDVVPSEAFGTLPHLQALAFDETANALIVALSDASGPGSGDHAIASIDTDSRSLLWLSPAAAPLSGLAVLHAPGDSDGGIVVAAEGANLVVRTAATGVVVPSAHDSAYDYTGALLASDPARGRVIARLPTKFVSRHWMRGACGSGGSFAQVTAPRADLRRPFDVSAPGTFVLPPLLSSGTNRPDGSPFSSSGPAVYVSPAGPETDAVFSILSVPMSAVLARHTFPVPVVGLAPTFSGTALVVADAAGDVRVLRWPLQGSIVSSSTLSQSVTAALTARRQAAVVTAAAAGTGRGAALADRNNAAPTQEEDGSDAAVPVTAEAVRAAANAAAVAAGAVFAESPPPLASPRLQTKYGHIPPHQRLAAVELEDYMELFGIDRGAFEALPAWKRDALRKKARVY